MPSSTSAPAKARSRSRVKKAKPCKKRVPFSTLSLGRKPKKQSAPDSLPFPVHPVADKLRELSTQELAALEASLIQDGQVQLRNKIAVSHDGQIVDGRHRARLICKAGLEAELAHQIQNGGEWVEILPEGVNLLSWIARNQLGRRNCTRWWVAYAFLDDYRRAVAEGNQRRGKRHGKRPSDSPVNRFCKSVGISKTLFGDVDRVFRNISRTQKAQLLAGKIRFHQLAKKNRRPDAETAARSNPASLLPRETADGPRRTPKQVQRNGQPTDPLGAPSKTAASSSAKKTTNHLDRTRCDLHVAEDALPWEHIRNAAASIGRLLTDTTDANRPAAIAKFLESISEDHRQVFVDLIAEQR